MRKKIFNSIILFVGFFFCNDAYAASFLLNAAITNVKDQTTIYISYTKIENGVYLNVEDSTSVIDGKFSFKGDIEDLTAARLDFPNKFIRIYIEPSQMYLHIDGNAPYRYKMVGTKVENENIEFREQLRPYMEFYFKLLDNVIELSSKANSTEENSAVQDSIYHLIHEVVKAKEVNSYKMDRVFLDFASKHPCYQIVPDLLFCITENLSVEIDSIRTVYNKLSESVKNSMMGRISFKEIEDQAHKKEIEKAPLITSDFIMKTIAGDTIKLSNYLGKEYVLLDFWASWCAPCLKEIPKMKKIHKKYNEKGLTVIGISLDKDKNRWNETIQAKGLNHWVQVLDSEIYMDGQNLPLNSLSDLFGCDAIPFYVLIDKGGKVIAKWTYLGDAQISELDRFIEN